MNNDGDKCLPDKSEAHFNDLAKELAYNYFACSFGKERSKIDQNKRKEICDLLLDDTVDRENDKLIRRTRNIMVIGAGASMDSYAGMPGGATLIEQIKNEYTHLFNGPLRSRYEQDKKEIQALTGKELNFENYLYILSKSYVTQPEIRKAINKFTNLRFAPVYFNELVAHMLKHSFIDAVINFNFEETLDQAIFEEIGEGNYYNVISDGHCIDLDSITADGTLKVPIYIKPHGTNSHKSTLRFTNKHYFDIPHDISTMLKCLVGGFDSSNNIEDLFNDESRPSVEHYRERHNFKNDKIDKVNLIVVGFNMESIEFLEILNSYLPTASEIFYINYEPPKPWVEKSVYLTRLGDFFLSKDTKEWEKWKNNRYKIEYDKDQVSAIEKKFREAFKFILSNDRDIKLSGCTQIKSFLNEYEKKENGDIDLNCTWENSLPPLGRLFHYLFSEVWKSFKQPYVPQHIHRHKFVNLLFFDPTLRDPDPAGLANGMAKLNNVRKNFEKEYLNNQILLGCKEYNYQYFLDRTIVEIAIAYLRGHGAIDFHEFSQGRVDIYYKLYREMVEKYNVVYKNSPNSVYSLAELAIEFEDGEEGRNVTTNLLRVKTETEFNNIKIESFTDNFCNTLTEEINNLLNDKGIYERNHGKEISIIYKRRMTATIIYRLFSHRCVSAIFRSRIEKANRENGFVGIQRVESKDGSIPYVYKKMTHLQMMIISANYLLGSNFFSISTHHANSELYIWQSFKLQNQLHTILKLNREINGTLQKIEKATGKAKQLVLSVSEVGGNIRHHIKRAHTLNAHYVQICSFEAVRQLHGSLDKMENAPEYFPELIKKHKEYMLGLHEDSSELEISAVNEKMSKLTLLLIPFTLHNHHMTLFTDVIKEEVKKSSSVYIWRRGFSTQMNPIIIKPQTDIYLEQTNIDFEFVKSDLETLYGIFIKYFGRGLIFNHRNNLNPKDPKDPKDPNVCNLKESPNLYEGIDKLDTFNSKKLIDLNKNFLKYLPFS